MLLAVQGMAEDTPVVPMEVVGPVEPAREQPATSRGGEGPSGPSSTSAAAENAAPAAQLCGEFCDLRNFVDVDIMSHYERK